MQIRCKHARKGHGKANFSFDWKKNCETLTNSEHQNSEQEQSKKSRILNPPKNDNDARKITCVYVCNVIVVQRLKT